MHLGFKKIFTDIFHEEKNHYGVVRVELTLSNKYMIEYHKIPDIINDIL
jgi:hypothetical protein